MRILITGGNGMVGSYLKNLLPDAITPSSKELDLTNSEQVKNYFANNKFDYVIHLAAQAGVRHSINNPEDYATNNLIGFFNVNVLLPSYASISINDDVL